MERNESGRNIAIGAGYVKRIEITEATTLSANSQHVEVQIPLAAADDYDVTLPPVAESAGVEIYVSATRITGSYVDGGVQLVDVTDGHKASGLTNDKMTANADFWHVRNVLGLFWIEVAETTT